MAVSKEDILESISNMSVMDVVDLISAMEEKFGVSAAAPVAVAAGPAAGAEAAAAEEQTEFDVVMTSFGSQKDHGPGTEGSQGPRRRRAFQHQGRDFQRRVRRNREETRGSWRFCRGQVNILPGFSGLKKWAGDARLRPVSACISYD